MMIAVAVGTCFALMLVMMLNDPNVAKIMPPGQALSHFSMAPVVGLLSNAVVAGGGWLLWRSGRAREQREKPDLQRIFGDE